MGSFDFCLVSTSRNFARPMRFESRSLSEYVWLRHRNALTERAWEDAVQELDKLNGEAKKARQQD